jgi:hypothetical protein
LYSNYKNSLRIPRYRLHLQEIIKLTKPEHPDYQNLTEALVHVTKVAEELNEKIKESQNQEKILIIQSRFRKDKKNDYNSEDDVSIFHQILYL